MRFYLYQIISRFIKSLSITLSKKKQRKLEVINKIGKIPIIVKAVV